MTIPAKLMTIFSSKETPKNASMIHQMDCIGADLNCKINNIDREPTVINHHEKEYSKLPFVMNGETKGIVLRLVKRDQYCQILEMKYGRTAFNPAHIHPHYSVVHILSGEIIDSVRGKRFDKGDWYMIDLNEVHSAQSMSGAVVTVFNTGMKRVAESILQNKGYDITRIGFDHLKIQEK